MTNWFICLCILLCFLDGLSPNFSMKKLKFKSLIFVFVISFSTEILQGTSFIKRYFEIFDLVANAIGILLSYGTFVLYPYKKIRLVFIKKIYISAYYRKRDAAEKNPNSDLRNYSSLFLAFGLCFILFISWRAIEAKTYESSIRL